MLLEERQRRVKLTSVRQSLRAGEFNWWFAQSALAIRLFSEKMAPSLCEASRMTPEERARYADELYSVFVEMHQARKNSTEARTIERACLSKRKLQCARALQSLTNDDTPEEECVMVQKMIDSMSKNYDKTMRDAKNFMTIRPMEGQYHELSRFMFTGINQSHRARRILSEKSTVTHGTIANMIEDMRERCAMIVINLVKNYGIREITKSCSVTLREHLECIERIDSEFERMERQIDAIDTAEAEPQSGTTLPERMRTFRAEKRERAPIVEELLAKRRSLTRQVDTIRSWMEGTASEQMQSSIENGTTGR